MESKYPQVQVQMVGRDGNAFSMIGRVMKALKEEGIPREERTKFMDEATSSEDYDALLVKIMEWVDVN